MKSPFPGMDPFLEDAVGWQDFHTKFLVEMSHAISARVSPNFFVRVEERVYLTEPGFCHASILQTRRNGHKIAAWHA